MLLDRYISHLTVVRHRQLHLENIENISLFNRLQIHIPPAPGQLQREGLGYLAQANFDPADHAGR